jgi:hypothetical protein
MCDTKKCTKCGKELPLDQFYKKKLKNGSVGRQCYCKYCVKIFNITWRKDNPEKVRAAKARWYKNNSVKVRAVTSEWQKNNPEKVRARNIRWRKDNPNKRRAAVANWKKNNPEKVRAQGTRRAKERRVCDPNFKIKQNIQRAIRMALNGRNRSIHSIELLGCSIEYLRSYLEQQFSPNMTWDNYGLYGWHIDHIIPLSYFDFTDPEQQRRAWHYTNLRPLWAADNLKKNNKLIEIQLKLQ